MKKNNLFEQASKIRKDEDMVKLDFTNPAHREFFLQELGGEENFQSQFPKLYQHYSAEVNGLNKKVTVGEPDVFQDAVDITYGFYDQKKKAVICKGVTSIKRNAQHICQRIHVYDMSGNIIVETGQVVPSTHHAEMMLDYPCTLTERQKKEGIVFDYFSLWYDEEEKHLNSALYSSMDELSWQTNSYIDKVTINNPKHIKTTPDSMIIVCYDRSSASGETVDYDCYKEAFDEKTHQQLLYLDVGADVDLNSQAGTFSTINLSRFLLKLDCQSGIAEYKKEGRTQEIMNKFKATEKGFSFALDNDWLGTVPAARLPMREPVDFLLRLEFLTDNYQKKGRLIIDSHTNPDTTGDYVIPISKLQLLWGCVAADTKILMADGTERLVKDIKIGDEILMQHNDIGVIKDTLIGREEKPLICIETVSGKKLSCTEDHPVLSQRGYVQAKGLTGEDKVMDYNKGLVSIGSIYPIINNEVYSLFVESRSENTECSVICNGIVTGDFEKQNEIVRRSMNKEKNKNANQINGEIKKLKVFFEG
ncbi:Hint domain-containing protein [Anaerovorax odorimutans]|uniref:Hint domain-containing protein n=1 Tax=Anaerovorax odorimutans TaxID=109327 RepID=UPI00040FDC00|nr:Hint domain-containing protein [Anaerovorax odorimutans]